MRLLVVGLSWGQLHFLCHFPSQASFLHMWDSNLVLGIIGSSCNTVHDPYFTSEMPCVLFILFSRPLVSPLGLGLKTSLSEDSASGFIMAVFWNTVPRKCPQNQTLVLNLGLWVLECSPLEGSQTCRHVGKCTDSLGRPSLCAWCPAWLHPVAAYWAPGLHQALYGDTHIVEHNPALNAQRLIKE